MRDYEVMRDKTNTITLRDDRKRIPKSHNLGINLHLIRTVKIRFI